MSDPPQGAPVTGVADGAPGDGDTGRLRELAHRLRQVHQRTAPRGEGPAAVELARRRLADLVEGVETCLLSDLPGPTVDEIAPQLAAVEQLFEGSGDPKTARVLEGVRESLSRPTAGDSEPPPPRRFEPPPRRRGEASPAELRHSRFVEVDEDPWDRFDEAPGGSRWWLVAAAVAVAAVVVVISWRAPGGGGDATSPVQGLVPSARPVVDRGGAIGSTPVPTRDWVSLEAEAEAYEERLEQVKLEVANGWRSIRAGDLESAVERLAVAASLDRHHRMVRELGRGAVEALVEAADDAADHGRWAEAPERLAQARALAESLSLDLGAVAAGEEQLAVMRRFDYVLPGNRGAIAAAVGRELRVTLTGAPALDGRLRGFADEVLSLEVDSGVPGGEVAFTTEIPLARVLEVRVYHHPPS